MSKPSALCFDASSLVFSPTESLWRTRDGNNLYNIEISGCVDGPNSSLVSLAQDIFPRLLDYVPQSLSFLTEVVSPSIATKSEDWDLEAFEFGFDSIREPDSFGLRFHCYNDIYGVWTVVFALDLQQSNIQDIRAFTPKLVVRAFA